jgi:N-acylglucosamine 2-epimerase
VSLTRYAERYERELFENVIPFWLAHSLDREHGGYFTALDREGRVFDPRKYIWLNARQVWTFSKLYRETGRKPEYLEAARLGAAFLRRHAFDEQGRPWFSLTREGAPAFFQRKPYAGLFLMLGFDEFAKATGETWFEREAARLQRDFGRWTSEPALLGRPAFPALPPSSALADIYGTLCMAQQKGETEPQPAAVQALDAHWVEGRRLWLETAALDPARRLLYPENRLICVGSIFEITWLLLNAPQPHARTLDALEGALEFGWDREYGGFFYFQDVEGKPMLPLEGTMKLWWVHVEAIYALVRAYAATRETRWLRWLEVVDGYTFSHFPDRAHGEWFGYLDREGRPTTTLKGNNYKGCFHIPRALWWSAQAIRALP